MAETGAEVATLLFLFFSHPFVDFKTEDIYLFCLNLSVGSVFSLNDQAPDSSPASRSHIGFFLCWKSWETLVNEAKLRVYLPGVPVDFGGK